MQNLSTLEALSRRLEPGATDRAMLLNGATQYVEEFFAALPQQPGFRTGTLPRLKALQIGDEVKPFEALLGILRDEVDVVGINSASGKHMGYIPGGGLLTSAVADLLAAAANRYPGIAYSSPGAVEIENQLIRWLTRLAGYPDAAHGNLTSGGSMANLIAIKAARDAYGIHSGNVKTAVIYFSGQVHHCIHKALHTTGLYEAVLRPIGLNERYQMDHHQLRQQIEADRAEGLKPFLVVATAGTTDTGAVDPLEEIAALCGQHGLWFHIDAAYGGFFMLVDEVRDKFKGVALSDSIVMDPHKTLFMPYGSGVVLLRDRQHLLASNAHEAAYMTDAYGREEVDPADAGPELSRHFRGLRMWLPLQLHGLAPFRAALAEKIVLCRYFHGRVALLGFETGPEPELSVAIFRYAGDPDNSINDRLIRALHADGRVFLSSTTIGAKRWIRCAVVHFRTHQQEVDLALDMIQSALSALPA